MTDYHINIFYSDEDRGYIADIPDLRACSAFGKTAEEALKEVEKAKAAWLEAARKLGKPIPAPRYRPVIYQSGQPAPQIAATDREIDGLMYELYGLTEEEIRIVEDPTVVK